MTTEEATQVKIYCDAKELAAALRAVLRFVPGKGTRDFESHIEVRAEGDYARLAATDGDRAIIRHVPNNLGMGEGRGVAHPSIQDIKLLLNTMPRMGMCSWMVPDHIITFPSLDHLIPEHEGEVAFQVKFLKDAIAALSDDQFCWLTANKNKPLLLRQSAANALGLPPKTIIVMAAYNVPPIPDGS